MTDDTKPTSDEDRLRLETGFEDELWCSVVAASESRNPEHMRNAVAAADEAVRQFRARRGGR